MLKTTGQKMNLASSRTILQSTRKLVRLCGSLAVFVKYAGQAKEVVSVGGTRVIYYNRLENGQIWLLLIYGKSAKENIPSHVLKQIKEAIEND